MNVIIKQRRSGSVNEIKKRFDRAKREKRDLDFQTGRIPRDVLSKLLIVCGQVSPDDVAAYRKKASEIKADFVFCKSRSWKETRSVIREHYEFGKHKGVLLIGDGNQLPSRQLTFKEEHGYTDWFLQDMNDDLQPDVPIGRVYGSREVVLYHLDPPIIDSNIAVIFDTEPDRSSRHVVALHKLGFDVEVLEKYHPEDTNLLASSEFILQFSDGLYTRRIHGNPEAWLSQNSVVLSHSYVRKISFKGYPVVFSEACSTANSGPLLRAFLDKGACYIGSPFETVNNIKPCGNWRECAAADGWKFGFLDLLDSYDTIGEVKMNVDINLFINLEDKVVAEIRRLAEDIESAIQSDEALSIVEWNLFGNPLRTSTRGPHADYVPGRIYVDT
ncbi:MAG: C25 family cysteine peptidase [Candidatus Thorarchaeota archaeon]|nr:C25 family cysteine peptidase [Candidatus Thorarchaeota archaeon]